MDPNATEHYDTGWGAERSGNGWVSEWRLGPIRRARNDAVLFALAFLAQIDGGDVGTAAQRHRFRSRQRPPFIRNFLLVALQAH